ncbi:MAG: ABC transporter permease [Bacillota bacterium]
MEMIYEGLVKAIELMLMLDPQVLEISWLTLKVSGTATFVSVLLGVPLGTYLALADFPGRRVIVSIVNFGMGLPPVVVGLWVSIFLWRSGPFGSLGIIYTPAAMIIAQAIIAAPVVTSFTLATMQQTSYKLRLQILALGANRFQLLWYLLREARLGLLSAIIAGFGAVVSEVGASMMVGGNILGETRVLTTATVMEVNKGNFELAIALSLVLLGLAYGVTLILTLIQQRRTA